MVKHIVNNKDLYKRPKRIGHGVRILSYYQKEKLPAEYKDIGFEICPLSNIFFMQQNIELACILRHQDNVCIGTDDLNKSNLNISHNFAYLYYIGLKDAAVFKKLALNSLIFSNCPNKEEKIKEFEIQFEKWA